MWTPRNTLILSMLIIGSMLGFAESQIIALLKPMLQENLKWSDSDYGRLTAASQFASAVALLGSGWLVDRIGWRRANLLSMGSRSLAAMAHAFADTLARFTLARIIQGTTDALATPTTIKTLAAVFKNRDRSLALGIMNMAAAPGIMLTPIFIPWVAGEVGWANTFLVTGAGGILWVAVWFLVSPPEIAGGADSSESGAAARSAGVAYLAVLADRRTWVIAGAKILSDPVYWLLLFWMPDLFHRVFHLSMAEYGAPLAVIHAVSAVGGLIGGWVPRQLMIRGVSLNTARKSGLLGAAILVTPIWLVLTVDNYWVATALLCLTLGAHQAYSNNVFSLAADITPSSQLGTVISLSAFSGRVAGTVILQCAGWAMDAGYGYAPLFAWASVSYLFSFAFVHMLQPRITPATPDFAG